MLGIIDVMARCLCLTRQERPACLVFLGLDVGDRSFAHRGEEQRSQLLALVVVHAPQCQSYALP